MWEIKKNRYINKQYDIEVVFDSVFKKWEIHFPINKKRRIKYYDTFKDASEIIRKEFGNEVYTDLKSAHIADEI